MTIAEDFAQIREQQEQLKAAGDVRRRLSKIYAAVENLDETVEYYKANTGFDDIPTDTKQALNRFYQLTLTLKTDFEADADFVPVIQRTAPTV